MGSQSAATRLTIRVMAAILCGWLAPVAMAQPALDAQFSRGSLTVQPVSREERWSLVLSLREAAGQAVEHWTSDGRRVSLSVQGRAISTAPFAVFDVRTELTGIASGGGGALVFFADGEPVLRLSAAPARLRWEGGQLIIESADDLSGRSLDLVIDGPELAGQGQTAPDDLLPARFFTGQQASAGFGTAVATAGDINGDGFSDLIVGAPGYNDGARVLAGQVRVYHGSPGGAVEALRISGAESDARLGQTLASAGDVNGDGYHDVIVGASGAKYVQVYLGSAAGLVTQNPWRFSDTSAASRVGTAVGWAGDVNGDGYSDVILGSRNSGNAGVVRVFCGSSAGLASPPWVAHDTPQSSNFGQAVASAGDVNGDGYSDILVGARTTDQGFAAYVYLGGRGTVGNPCGLPVPAIPHWTFRAQGDTGLGDVVATAGDIDGDGYADVVIGSNSSGNNRVVVIYGSPQGLAACTEPTPCMATDACRQAACCTQQLTGADGFGSAVASAGDWNGDGHGDMLVGVPDASSGEGNAHLFLGSCSGLRTPEQAIAQIGSTAGQAGFGNVVAAAGDVNGDGFGDLIVGAPAYRTQPGAFEEGGAFVFHGRSLPVPGLAPDWVVDDQVSFGDRFAPAGDVDGDGLGDLVEVEPTMNRIAVHRGFPTGTAPPPRLFIGGARFETAAAAGDIDGDGYGDVIAGAPFVNAGGDRRGQITVFRGSPTGLTAGWTVSGDLDQGRLGQSVAAAGDIDGDGYGDLIVGAPGMSGSPPREFAGAAFVFRGSPSGPIADDWIALGSEVGAQFGAAVAAAGDVNGDGFADVVVGAPCALTSPRCPSQRGRSFLYLGSASGLSDAPVWVAEGEPPFGVVVVSAGDVNGDGFSDVTIGQGTDATSSARALTFHGSAAGLSRLPATVIDEGTASDIAISAGADVDGDGYSDVLVGTSGHLQFVGRARLYRGSASGLIAAAPAWEASDTQSFGFGDSVAAVDLNGDSFADLVVGSLEGRGLGFHGNLGGRPRAPQQWRTDRSAPVANLGISDQSDAIRLQARAHRVAGDGEVRLQWELKPLHTLFDGQGLSRGIDAASRLESGRTFDPDFILNERAAGLDPHTYYRWRARIVSNEPLVPRSPWFSLPDGGVTAARFRTAGELPAPEFRPVGPAINELIPPDTPPLIFSWNRGSNRSFQVEFSRNFAFSGPIQVALPEVPGVDAPAIQTYTPAADRWCEILRLAQNPDFREIPVFWRVVAGDGAAEDGTENIRTLRVLPAQPPVVLTTAVTADAATLPQFAWQTRHNERFRLRFSATDFLGAPVVDSGSGAGDGFHIPANAAGVAPCSASAPETLSWTPAPELWAQVVQLAPAGGTIYWSVHARDALGRVTRSTVQALTIDGKRGTGPDRKGARH